MPNLSPTTGRILQISVSNGGVPKLPVDEVEVADRGITVDKQDDTERHGGPWQALCLWGMEQIQEIKDEGHSVAPGLTGENITTEGLDLANIPFDTKLALGDTVVIQLTKYTVPCRKNAQWFLDGNIGRMDSDFHPQSSRVYASVLTGGTLRTGDTITVIE